MKKLMNRGSKTVYAAVYNYPCGKEIPLSNLQQIATGNVKAMSSKHNGSVAPHIVYWLFTALFIKSMLQLKL